MRRVPAAARPQPLAVGDDTQSGGQTCRVVGSIILSPTREGASEGAFLVCAFLGRAWDRDPSGRAGLGERDRIARGERRSPSTELAIKLFRPMPIWPVLRRA